MDDGNQSIEKEARVARKPRKQRPQTRATKPRQIGGKGSIVISILRNKRSDLVKLKGHILDRTEDGWSKIDPAREDRNEVLHGSGNVLDDVKAVEKGMDTGGHKRATDAPYLTLVLGASPEFFRPAGGPAGSETATEEGRKRIAAWKKRNLDFLKDRFGADLASVVYHGDETTPHIHAVIVPSYEKMAGQRPRRHKAKMETDEDHAARVAEWEATTPRTRTRSWSSNPVIGRHNSAQLVRQEYADAMSGMGLQYSLASFEPAAPSSPRETREWVADTAKAIVAREKRSRATMERAEAVMSAVSALASEVAEETLYMDDAGKVWAGDMDALRQGMPEIKEAVRAMAAAASKLTEERAEVAKQAEALNAERQELAETLERVKAKESALDKAIGAYKRAKASMTLLAKRWGLLDDKKPDSDFARDMKEATQEVESLDDDGLGRLS